MDKAFIHDTVLRGVGVIDEGPISSVYKDFYTPEPPRYPNDPARAIAFQAGCTRHRVEFPAGDHARNGNIHPRRRLSPPRAGQGGHRGQDRDPGFPTFVKRVYTDRDFDMIIAGGQMGPDPVIGTRRWCWSKSYKPGRIGDVVMRAGPVFPSVPR